MRRITIRSILLLGAITLLGGCVVYPAGYGPGYYGGGYYYGGYAGGWGYHHHFHDHW